MPFGLFNVTITFQKIVTQTFKKPIVGVEDQLLDAILFLLTSDWYTPIKKYLRKGYFEDDVPQEEHKRFTIKSRPYTFYGEKLYKLGPDGILW